MTSRINWAIQSSGVDYLHLLIVSMDYLIRRFRIDARLAITVHDEIRYLCRWTDRYRAAMALQVANVWTRAMFSQQMGIDDLPQSCAYFSAIDIDSVLRKEVDTPCVTPSHPDPIPPGESLDIEQLLDKGRAAAYLDSDVDTSVEDGASSPVEARADVPQPQRYAHLYTTREPVMAALRAKKEASGAEMPFLKAQLSSDERELNDIVRDVRVANAAADAATAASIGAALHDEEQQQQQKKKGAKKPRKKAVQGIRSNKANENVGTATATATAKSFADLSSSPSTTKTPNPADRYGNQHPSYPYRYRYRPAPKLVPVDPDRFAEASEFGNEIGAGDGCENIFDSFPCCLSVCFG